MSSTAERMDYETLNDLLEHRGLIDDEGTRVEIKSGKGGLPNGFWTSVNAFSNTVGGYILLGFHDVTREVVKDLEIDRLQKDISSGVSTKLDPPVSPTVDVLRVAGQKIIMVSVAAADTHLKPIYLTEKGKKGWKRVGSSNLQLSKEDIEKMLLEKAGKSPDSYVVSGFGLRHLDAGTLARYRQRLQNLRPTHRLLSKTDEQLLQSLNCLTYSPDKDIWELNRAGLLIFGQEQFVRSVFPSLEVQILRFDEPNWELTAQNRGKKTVLEGRALFDFVPDLEETLLQLFPPTVKVTSGKFGREPDPIYDALREAIINAIVHQDFLAARYIQVRLFSDRLEIENPGYSKKPVELFSEPGSVPRNPLVAYAFEIIEYVEKQGFGGSIMIDSIEKAGFTPPNFNSNVDKNSFTVTFSWQHFMSQEDLEWVAKFGEMPEDDKKALVYAKNNKAMKNADVRRLCGHDTLKASRVLQRLKSRHLLNLHGTGKQAYYTLNAELPPAPKASRQFGLFDDVTLSEPDKTLSQNTETLSESTQTLPQGAEPLPESAKEIQPLFQRLQAALAEASSRAQRRHLIEEAIVEFATDFVSGMEIAELIGVTRPASRTYIQSLLDSQRLELKYPALPNHRNQAYRTRQIPQQP